MYLTGRENTSNPHTHKHFRAVFTPASLLGTALGPEGPRCRGRIGVGEAGTEEEGAEKETGEGGG